MFAKLLGIFSGGSLVPWTMLGGLVAMVGSFGVGVYLGHHYGLLQHEAALSSASQAVAKTTEKQALVTEEVGQAFASQQAKTQVVIQTIIKKVPVYVTQNANSRCVIPAGAIYLSGEGFKYPSDARTVGLGVKLLSHPEVTDRWEVYSYGLRNTLIRLSAANKKILFVIDTPELGFDPKSCFDACLSVFCPGHYMLI